MLYCELFLLFYCLTLCWFLLLLDFVVCCVWLCGFCLHRFSLLLLWIIAGLNWLGCDGVCFLVVAMIVVLAVILLRAVWLAVRCLVVVYIVALDVFWVYLCVMIVYLLFVN